MSTFYDIHCHIMDLSHPNIKAFLERKGMKVSLFKLPKTLTSFLDFLFNHKYRNIRNLLYLMDNTVDEFLKQTYKLDIEELFVKNDFRIDDVTYDRIILTPLMMDFGIWKTEESDKKIHFNKIPKQHNKIRNQTIDLFNGITDFFKNSPKNKTPIEMYPFLGLNTKNYDLKKNADKSKSSLEDILTKYFKKMPEHDKHKILFDNMGSFTGDINKMKAGHFAGIKLYPPLGFDPWPVLDKDYESDAERNNEQEKVEYFYKYASSNGIPITIHCGGSGYNILDSKKECEYTSPDRWKTVLEKYPDLKINLAHFGSKKMDWMGKIFRLLCDYKNVYTDISYLCYTDKMYTFLDDSLKLFSKKYGRDNFQDKILFGTDFMINLMDLSSYSEYLQAFASTKNIGFKGLKNKMCEDNPKKFLGF